MTVSETRMGRARYTEFRTLPQTLQAVYEYSEDLYPDPYPEDPLVNRIWIHDLNPPPKMEEEN